MTVFKRNGKWVAEVATGDYTAAGKPRRTRRVAATKAEALRLERELLTQRDRGTPVPRADLTVGMMLAMWIAEMPSRNLAPRTIESYNQICRDHLVPHVGRHRLIDLHQSHVNKLVKNLAANSYAAHTQRLVRRTLGVALNYAMRNDLVFRNVVALSNPVSVPRRKELRIKPEQLTAMLAAIQASPNRDLIATYIYTGMRRGEAVALKWSDLHLDEQEPWLSCERSYTATGGKFEIRTTKTVDSKRIVSIPADLRQMLLERKKSIIDHDGYTEEQLSDMYVFARFDGVLPRPDNLTKEIRKLGIAAGVSGMGPHQFRHLFATMLHNQGTSTAAISSHLGHSDISTTVNIYTHKTPSGVSQVGHAFQTALDEMDRDEID
jgi:integrase